jgi:hypothetical protein
MQKMGRGFDATYIPNEERHQLYEERYNKYCRLAEFIEQQGETQ